MQNTVVNVDENVVSDWWEMMNCEVGDFVMTGCTVFVCFLECVL